MATIVAAAGGGNWNSNGTWVGGVVPGSADDVVLNATSGNVSTVSSAACRSLDCTGYTGTLSHGSFTISIGDGTAGAGTIALKLSAGMTYAPASGRLIAFVSTSATQQTITTAGKTLGSATFAGAGSSYLLSDAFALVSGNILTFTAGTLNTGNFAVSGAGFVSSGSTARTLTPGSSNITLNSSSGSPWNVSGSNFTVTANTATVTLSASGVTFAGGGVDYNGMNVVLNGTGATLLSGANTFGNLTRTGGATIDSNLNLSADQIVTGTLTLTGNASANRLWVLSNVVGTPRTITCNATVTASRVDFEDIVGAGSASWNLAAITDGSGDCGGNSGITFTTPVTLFARATGNWSTAATWSLISGGGAATVYPLPQDTATLNAASGAITVTMDMQRHSKDIVATGFTGTLSLASSTVTRYIFGSLTLSAGMTFTATGFFTFAGRGSHTINMAGKAFVATTNRNITIGRFGGTYTLLSNANFGAIGILNNTQLITAGGVTFDANDFDVTVPQIVHGTATINMGSGSWYLISTLSAVMWTAVAGTTINAETSNIVMAGASPSAHNFTGGDKTYYDLTYTVADSPGRMDITGSNTFHDLTIGSGRYLRFAAATTTTITGAFTVNGANYGYQRQPGTIGEMISVPDSAALSITSDITLLIRVAMNDWTPAADSALLNKRSAAGVAATSYEMYVQGTTGLLGLVRGTGALNQSYVSTVSPVVTDGDPLWVLVSWRQSDGRIQFFTASGAIANPVASDFTQLGTDVTGPTTAMSNTTAVLEIGTTSLGTAAPMAGNIYRAKIYNGVFSTAAFGGTVQLDADFASKTFGANTFTEGSANAATVTIPAGALMENGDGRVTITTSTAANHNLVKSGAVVSTVDYAAISRSQATPGSTWYAGANSVNNGNNTGWIFTAAPRTATAALSTPSLTIAATASVISESISATAALTTPYLSIAALASTEIGATTTLIIPNLFVSSAATVQANAYVSAVLAPLQAFGYGLSLAQGGSALFLPLPIISAEAGSLATTAVDLVLVSLQLHAESDVSVSAMADLVLASLHISTEAEAIPGASSTLLIPSLIIDAQVNVSIGGVSDFILPTLQLSALAIAEPGLLHTWLSALAGPIQVLWSASLIETDGSAAMADTFWSAGPVEIPERSAGQPMIREGV